MSYSDTINTIKRRYIHERAIYTWCGIALVAVNPYQEQDIYGEQVVETYHSAAHSVYLQLDPHIYAVTEDAYSKLDLHMRDQSIIVSGESGAGKTVSAKHAMRYLASIAGHNNDASGASSSASGAPAAISSSSRVNGGSVGSATGKSSSKSSSSNSTAMRIEDRVLASNPIMEAIGNASTVRNDNSSRFGKYIQIYFERHGRRILGANMRTYLLEKSRVTKQQVGERNFHIFYQLLNYAHKNPLKMAHLKLLDAEDNQRMRRFDFLAGIEPAESRDDLRRFNEALRTLNIDEQRIDVIYRIVAGILHGGNIRFVPEAATPESSGGGQEDGADGPCTLDLEEYHFRACCELIGLDPELTRKRLTVRLLRSGARDIIEQPQSRQKAEYTRDAMLKYIYECLFTWLVALINLSLTTTSGDGSKLVPGSSSEHHELVTPTGAAKSLFGTPTKAGAAAHAAASQGLVAPLLKSPSSKKSILEHANSVQHQQQQVESNPFIGVLDIYGFENFKTNSFEQFCINYANEVLQQQYNQHVFKIEQEEYIREGIDWTFIEYSDNQPVIDIIESRPIGILNLLDEECKMPKGTDQSWCAKLYDQLLPPAGGGSMIRSSKKKSNGVADAREVNAKEANAARFKRPKMNYQSSFVICHYAEDVTYEVATFLEKNRDTIAEEQCEMLRASHVLSYIFEDPLLVPAGGNCVQQLQISRPGARMRTSRSATVGHQFRGSLAALIRTLNATEPHYIRCIKPNDEKKAFEFDEERAVQQLKACGVYETIRISNNGFPSRWHYKDFAKRYCILVYGTQTFDELARASLARRKRQQQALEEAAAAAATQEDSQEYESSSESSHPREDEQELEKKEQEEEKDQEELEDCQQRRHLFMCQFSSADIRPICEAICASAYGRACLYEHLRTDEEQAYISQLCERHGDKPSAIYQFGKSKIFFRAGQVAYLERVRNLRLRDYTLTIQRHVRGWLARKSFAVRRELYLEELRREASLLSLQAQVSSLQTELAAELARKEQLEQEQQEEEERRRNEEAANLTSCTTQPDTSVATTVSSRLGSMYSLIIDMMFASIQPLIISAVLEYEALDPPDADGGAFSSLDSSSRSPSPDGAAHARTKHSMDFLIGELDKFYDLTRKNCVPEDIAAQAFKQIFYLICAHSLNQLLIRRDLCQFRKAMQINFNLSCLVQWCRERYLVKWRDIVEQLDPITQATKLLQTRKSSEDIATIEEVCNKLRPSQIIKMLNMYTSTYEEQITFEFIHELEEYLNRTRASKQAVDAVTGDAVEQTGQGETDSGFDVNNNSGTGLSNNDLLMDTKHYFAFVDLPGAVEPVASS